MIYMGNILSMNKLEQSHIKSPILDYIHMVGSAKLTDVCLPKVDDVGVVT